jgi:hypothetical protein
VSRALVLLVALLLPCAGPALAAEATRSTVLYAGASVALEGTLQESGDLWIRAADLVRAGGFELKPQGACREDVCIPVKQSGAGSLVRVVRREKLFNLTAFARKLGQAFMHDTDAGVWSFGEIPVLGGGFLQGAMAPDFALADRAGRLVRLSDFRGKKVLLLTWASW